VENLPQNEPKRYKRWEELKVYEQMEKIEEKEIMVYLYHRLDPPICQIGENPNN